MSRLLLALIPLPLLVTACPTGQPSLEPKLSVIQSEIFFPSCGSFESCHGGSNPQSGLDMATAQASFDTMIDVPGEEAAGTRVVPGDADSSLLYQLLLGPVDNARQMPIGYQLPDDELEVIRRWIEEGAQNN